MLQSYTERCSIHLLYIIELRFYIRVIFDAYPWSRPNRCLRRSDALQNLPAPNHGRRHRSVYNIYLSALDTFQRFLSNSP